MEALLGLGRMIPSSSVQQEWRVAMSSDRREFLRQATVVAAGLSARAFPLTAQQRSSTMPTARASALMAAFGLKYPIFCAGMAAVAIPELAIAVSNGGGLGA